MNHSEAELRLWDYHDGELPSEKRRRMESHLQACLECRRTLDGWRDLSSRIFPKTGVPSAGDTERFVHRVMSRLESNEPEANLNWLDLLSSRWLVPALGAGLAAAIFLTAPMTRSSKDPVETMFQQEAASEGMMSWISGPPPTSADAFSVMAGVRE